MWILALGSHDPTYREMGLRLKALEHVHLNVVIQLPYYVRVSISPTTN